MACGELLGGGPPRAPPAGFPYGHAEYRTRGPKCLGVPAYLISWLTRMVLRLLDILLLYCAVTLARVAVDPLLCGPLTCVKGGYTSCSLAYTAYVAFPRLASLCVQVGLGPSRNVARCGLGPCAHPPFLV